MGMSRDTPYGICILAWKNRFLFFPINRKHTIVHKRPFTYPLRSTVNMLTRISIPHDDVSWFFSQTDVPEQDKGMLSRKSCDTLTCRESPSHDTLVARSITGISRSDRKWSDNVTINFFDDTIFVVRRSTPVSPEHHRRSWVEETDHTRKSLSRETIWVSSTIWERSGKRISLCVVSKRLLVDTVSRESSLTPCVWTDEFALWISPVSSLEWSCIVRNMFYDIFLGRVSSYLSTDEHTQSCYLTWEFIFLESELILFWYICRWFSQGIECQIGGEFLELSREFLPLEKELLCSESSCLSLDNITQ